MKTYSIFRYYHNGKRASDHVKSGLTLEEAEEHCRDPETSSQTCCLPDNKARTARCGPWFDGYTKE